MAHAQTAPGFDPRKIITPESFHVAPHLLGLPLASPSRRLAAILVDLLLVSILANSGKIAFAFAVALAFFWFAGRKLGNSGGFFSRSVRAAFRGFGALMLFVAAISIWNHARRSVDEVTGDDDDGDKPTAASMSVNGSGNGNGKTRGNHVTIGTAARATVAVAALESVKDSAGAFHAARNAVVQFRRMQMSNADIREALTNAGNDRTPAVRAGIMAALPPDSSDTAASDSAGGDSASAAALAAKPDSLAALYVVAVHAGDSAHAATLRPRLGSAFARDSLDRLHARVSELHAENQGLQGEKRALEAEKKKAENRGLLSILLEWLDDLGIGLGWTGLYFTAFTALWRGQTPGKKLFGIRVLRLDGEAMTLWASFERFGGYAAGLFTGLSGYAQVLWDRNRQAIQDKISETVVIRELRGIPLPTAPQPPRPVPPRWPPAGVGAP